MFSFIKWLQLSISKLKRNKGLWFTTLSIASTAGVLISMYTINIMTSSVAEQTYQEERRVDLAHFDAVLTRNYDELVTTGTVLALHPQVVSNLKSKNYEALNTLTAGMITSINKNIIETDLDIKYYDIETKIEESENHTFAEMVMETNYALSGLMVNKKGVRMVGIVPVFENNVTIGALEVSRSIHSIKEQFLDLNKEFVFIIDKHQLVFLDLKSKTGRYLDVSDEYKVAYKNYDSNFYINASQFDLQEMMRNKYHIDKKFFTTYEEVTDLNGRIIGLVLIGEDSNNASSFVKITQNMINSVTTVALGLVISLILFMF